MMDRLEMLSQREQLMEDIDAIVDEYFKELRNRTHLLISHRDAITKDSELVKALCDAVCKNFPTES